MKYILIPLCFIIFNTILYAQGTHYWSNQFGARASFLGGAVIAGLDDNSSVYYNPANLAFIKQSTVSLNTSVYKYEDIFMGNGGGTGVDLKSQRLSLYQQMVSGLLSKNPEKFYRIGFNILARQNVNIDGNHRHENKYDLIASNAGKEFYIGNIELRNIIGETWGCLGVGFKINKNFSAGLTAIATYRSQKHTFAYSARAMSGNDSTIAAGIPIFVATNSSYLHSRTNIIGGLLKVGFHGRFGRWRFGLNISTPSITIWGESRVHREDLQTNRPSNQGSGTLDRVRTDEQRNLKSRYKYPLSVGAGISYNYRTGMICISAEYFMAINEYKMVDANLSNFSIYDSVKTDFLSIYQRADQVLNFAIGWEQKLLDKIKLHIGFRSDFSFIKTTDRLTITSAPIDLWHFSAGLSWRRKHSLMSIGFKYTYGYSYKGFRQLINFTEPLVNNDWFLFGKRTDEAFLNIHAFTLMIGYTYYFALK
ncbi:hypothetical protein OAK19_04465 [Aureispira]|nr:hypothetical protein [Aureispira sp.]